MEKRMLARRPLGNPRRLWQQDVFMLSTFNPDRMSFHTEMPDAADMMRRAVKTCADAGFNLLELGWSLPVESDAAVRRCEELDIKVIYQNLKRYGGMNQRIFCEKSDLLSVMREYKQWKSIAGYYIWDEPPCEAEMLESRRLMDLCEREMPEGLPFIVALPSYGKPATWHNGLYPGYLEQYASIIDPVVFSMDYYPIGMDEHDLDRQLDESLIWCDLGVSRLVAQRHDMPFWFYYQGQNLHNYPVFTFSMVRLMMNAGVLYGVKGLQHYTAWGAVVGPDGGPGEFFDDQKAMHARLRELGGTLMALRCKRVIHDETLLPGCPYTEGLFAEMEESECLTGKLDRRVSVSEHQDDYGNLYLMVLNRDYAQARDITLELRSPSRVWEVSPEDGRQRIVAENAASFTAHHIPGELRLYRIESANASPVEIEYYLDK